MKTKVKIDKETGEMENEIVVIEMDKVPAISINLEDVAVYHTEPEKLVQMISVQAGSPVFDVSTRKGRDECKSHAANIIRCISPAIEQSKRLAADAKKIINQDLSFRRDFELGVRTLAALHRKPLTEYEEEQERIKQEQIDRENARLAAEQAEIDRQAEEDRKELEALRLEREAIRLKQEAEQKAIEDKRLFDEAVLRRAEEMKLAEQKFFEEKRKADEQRAQQMREADERKAEEARLKKAEESKQDLEAIPDAGIIEESFDYVFTPMMDDGEIIIERALYIALIEKCKRFDEIIKMRASAKRIAYSAQMADRGGDRDRELSRAAAMQSKALVMLDSEVIDEALYIESEQYSDLPDTDEFVDDF